MIEVPAAYERLSLRTMAEGGNSAQERFREENDMAICTRHTRVLLEARAHLVVLLLSSLIVLVGILYSFQLGAKLRYADEHEYYGLATNLIAKHVYTVDGANPTAFRPPGYPIVLALGMLLGADIPYLRVINFMALGLTVYVTYLITTELSCKLSGLLVSLMICFYPVLFYMAGTLYPQTVGALFFLFSIFITLKLDRVSIFYVILSGLSFGFLVITIPTFLVHTIMIFIWLLFWRRCYLKSWLSVVLSTLLIISIWSFRNYLIFNKFILVSYNNGITLLHGNSENTTANIGPHVDISKYLADSADMTPIEKSSYYSSKAIEFILADKPRAVKLYFYKLLNHFNYYNEFDVDSQIPTGNGKDLVMLLTYGPLLLLAGVRLFFIRRFPLHNFEILFFLLYILQAFVSAIFITRIRYRLPFDFFLMIIVAIFIDSLIRSKFSRELGKN
jgi:hypothetical protein